MLFTKKIIVACGSTVAMSTMALIHQIYSYKNGSHIGKIIGMNMLLVLMNQRQKAVNISLLLNPDWVLS